MEQDNHDLRSFNIITTLTSVINENEENDTYVFLAKWMLNNLHRLEDLSIYDIADECFVSRSSLQRFIKFIGFESFNNLKAKIPEAIDHNQRFKRFYMRENFHEVYRMNMHHAMETIDKLVSMDTINYFVDLIHISRQVVISYADSSTLAARDFQEAMISLGKMVRCVTNASRSIELLDSLDERDLLITLSMTGNYAFATLNQVKALHTNKVLLTMNKTKTFQDAYDKVVCIQDEEEGRDYIQEPMRNAMTIYGFTYLFDLILNQYFMKYDS